MNYQKRTITQKLHDLTRHFPLIGVRGPFSAGKTTLLINEFPEHQYVNFEDHRTLMQYQQDPERFLRHLPAAVIFDEIHYAPSLMNTLINRTQATHRYIMSSSCLFHSIRSVEKEQLKHIKMLTLLPLQRNEIARSLQEDSVYRGGFPALVKQHYEHTDAWFTRYLQHLFRQIPNTGLVNQMPLFQQLLHMLAANIAKPLNLSWYAHQLTVDGKTIKRWIELLASHFVIILIPAYPQNFGKRNIKSSKLYFYDTGLVSYLTGIDTRKQFEFGPMASVIFENYVVMEILKKTLYEEAPAQLYHYATNHGVCIDLIIQRAQKRQMISIYFNETFRTKMLQPLETFQQEHDEACIIYNGVTMPPYKNIQIHNISTYLHSN